MFHEEEEKTDAVDSETLDEVTAGYIRKMQKIVYDGEMIAQDVDIQIENEVDFDNENQLRRKKT